LLADAVAASKHSVPANSEPAKIRLLIYFLPDAEARVSASLPIIRSGKFDIRESLFPAKEIHARGEEPTSGVVEP
jgi:hypothetical protein